jgi:hypothetical protein
LIVVTCLGGLLPSASLGQTIVWTDANARKIQRKEVSGGAVQTIVQFPAPQEASQIHYDPITAKLYYLIFSGGTLFIQRANLDGSDPETIPTPSVGNFTLNVELRKLYWSNSDTMYRSDLNGSGVESHTYPNCCLKTLEALGDDLFFGASGDLGKGVWRADTDGSNEQFLHESGAPRDFAYDPVENKLYLANIGDIVRLNTDGSAFETVVLNSVSDSVAVDYLGRKVYWWAPPGLRLIQRANLDGSNVEDFVTASDVGNPNFDVRGLTIVYNSMPIPALSGWGLMVMSVILLAVGMFVLRKRARAGQ